MKKHHLLFITVLLLCACQGNKNKTDVEQAAKPPVAVCYTALTTDKEWFSTGKKAPKFDGLNGIDFKISTKNAEAQYYFNQGMMLAYGFNHAEAARSFYEATRLDTACAMAYWGFAYVLGPNYNGGMEDDNYERAYAATVKAQALSNNSTEKEKALIAALATRYAQQPPANRNPLDVAYAAAMKKVYATYPSDPDVGALYAEAIMDIHPWDLYDNKTKEPKAWTPELTAVLEHLLKTNPRHPGAHHFYVHAMEASAQPEKALHSAAVLGTLVPGAGHLVHMPSHIYINTGDYHLGSVANSKAVEVDSIYTEACHAQGAYPLAYYPHNYHFLAATATLEGNSKLAWLAAKKLQEHTAVEIMDKPLWATLQHYYTIPYYVAVKFAMWDTILTQPAPPEKFVYPQVIWHYARTMAFLGKKNLPKAQQEMARLNTLAADTSLKSLSIWGINTMTDITHIAVKLASAEAALQQGQTNKAIVLLKEAVVIEDSMNYNEPPDWFFSVRHHLGVALIKAGKYSEAESAYRTDLKKWKKNGWALIGLYNALMLQQKNAEAQKVNLAFNEAWKYADVKIVSSWGNIN